MEMTLAPADRSARAASNSSEADLQRLVTIVQESHYSFVTVTPATHRKVNARPEHGWARSLRDVLGWSRPFHEGVLPEAIERALHQSGVVAPHENGWISRVRISSLAGMLFLHSAYPTLGADAVFFGPDTYRFADAVQALLQSRPGGFQRCVDIGCGAGPGGIVVARALPACDTLLVDINDNALCLARANAAAAGVRNVRLCKSDLLSAVDGCFDLIIANPPYLVDPAERAYRHGGGPLGAALSLEIVRVATERLAVGGTLLLYTGAAVLAGVDPFHTAAGDLLDKAGLRWSYREVDPDVFGEELEREPYLAADRIAAVVLTATREK